MDRKTTDKALAGPVANEESFKQLNALYPSFPS